MRVDADDFARPCSCGREHHIDVRETPDCSERDFDRSRSCREA